MTTALLVALGAALGAPTRFALGHWLDRDFPTGTLLANVVGSFLLGLLSALALGGATMAFAGVGFCGALTTYSALAVRTHERGPRDGAVYAGATITLSLALCAVGFWLGAQA